MNINQAEKLFRDWPLHRAAGLPPPNWRGFFNKWNKSVGAKISSKQNVLTFDCDRFAGFARDYFDAYKLYRASGEMTNVWRVADLRRDEVRNCRVLAWLIDSNGDHGQGSAILQRLIARVEGLEIFANMKNIEIGQYKTRTEVVPIGNEGCRIDIEISGDDFVIFIEAKIMAREADGQLNNYSEHLERRCRHKKSALIFLTPDGRGPRDNNLEGVFAISWRDISREIREYTKGINATYAGSMLKQYADHILRF